MTMQNDIHPSVISIQAILRQIDAVVPLNSSRQELETMLIDEVAGLLDEALPWQRGHGRRTARLAQSLGSAAGFSHDTLHHLTLASLLHDIGLLALPKSLISSPECLDFCSYSAVQSHPRLGAQWLEPFGFLRRASVIIAHHHERWDGSGYPYGIRGVFIPVEARVLAIADALDAIEVPGIDDQAARNEVAFRILKAVAGTQFDPHLVELCRQGFLRPVEETELPIQDSALFSALTE
jgi:HD-GYP domain-containing protein (c-di-GMP phosphodiesterase class II)